MSLYQTKESRRERSNCTMASLAGIRGDRWITNLAAMVLLVACSAGCSTTSSKTISSTVAAESGEGVPWDVQVERGLMKHQLHFGPYKTTWLGPMSSGKAHRAAAKGNSVSQVNYAREATRFEFELMTPTGAPVQVSAGDVPGQDKSLSLGSLKIPVGITPSGITHGTMTRDDRLIGQFRMGLGSDDPQGCEEGDHQYGSLSVGQQEINITSHVELDIWKVTSMSALSVAYLTFELNGQKIAVAEWKPEPRVWIDGSVSEDVRLAIASLASVYISRHRDIEDQMNREATSNFLGIAAGIAPAG